MLYCSGRGNASERHGLLLMRPHIGAEPEKGQNATALGLLAPGSIH
jgi:hypothetical protein